MILLLRSLCPKTLRHHRFFFGRAQQARYMHFVQKTLINCHVKPSFDIHEHELERPQLRKLAAASNDRGEFRKLSVKTSASTYDRLSSLL